MVLILRRLILQDVYRPVREDWFFHFVLPLFSYGLLIYAALSAFLAAHVATFSVGTACLISLLTGVHNAWDAVTYHMFAVRPDDSKS